MKHSRTGTATLYVVVDQNTVDVSKLAEIKKDTGRQAAPPDSPSGANELHRRVTYSISQIIEFVNIVVTLYEPDNLKTYLANNEIVYDKAKMNGKYQVGSGHIVTVTHDNPFIDNSIPNPAEKINPSDKNSSKISVEDGRASMGWATENGVLTFKELNDLYSKKERLIAKRFGQPIAVAFKRFTFRY